MKTHGWAIRAEGVKKVYGNGAVEVRAVRGIDLDVGTGEVVLIMGPSGSGKTTLLSMLGAMLRPSAGRIEVDGVDLATLPESKLPPFRARRFGFVFQDFNLLSSLSASENVQFALNLTGVSGRAAGRRAEDLLIAFGLGDRLAFRPEKLSGGEKQRVAIARALANEPAVILADEPTANLDSKIGHEIARLLRRAASDEDRSVVIVSHDDRLKDIADRVLWLEDGRFRTVTEMATDPVCGMAVQSERAPHYGFDGETASFCSPACRDEFAATPERFAVAAAAARRPRWPGAAKSMPASGGSRGR
jgi:putative ABC transport system ATP-binding protein